MSETTTSRYPAAIVASAPVVLLAAFLWHPYIPGRLPNNAAVASAAAADTTRWAVAHLAAVVASAVAVLAFMAVRNYLREAGDTRWSSFGLPFIVLGSTLYAVLPGMEFAPLAAVESGADAQAAQAALQPWFLAVLFSGALPFAIGTVGFAVAIARSAIFSPRLAWLVVAALIVMAASRLVPLFAVQFYVQGAVALIALWPLAYQMSKHPQARPVVQTPPIPAR
ncbi:MAG: hypothetical protein M3O70_23720 [Actinomycetota bacterium]|nr:hypothetical protein [Actinomycetota bacterium]